jgi:hypothetical protein
MCRVRNPLAADAPRPSTSDGLVYLVRVFRACFVSKVGLIGGSRVGSAHDEIRWRAVPTLRVGDYSRRARYGAAPTGRTSRIRPCGRMRSSETGCEN